MPDVLEQLPAWTGFVSLAAQSAVAFLAGLLAAALATGIAGAPLRRAGDVHWAERARLAHPARVASLVVLLVVPALAAAVGQRYAGSLSAASPAIHAAVGALAALLGALPLHLRLNRRCGRPSGTLGAWLRDVAAASLGLYLHVVAAVAFGLLAPPGVGRRTLWFVVAAVVVAGFTFRGGGVALARLVRLARPAGERLRAAVARAAERTGIRPRGVDELAWAAGNAFALPGAGRVVFTRGAVERLDDAELTAIAAHELAHLGEGERLRSLRFATTLLLVVAIVLAKPVGVAYGAAAGFATLLGAFVVLIAFRGLARRLEADADAVARVGGGDDPGEDGDPGGDGGGAYARALEALYRLNVVPAVAGRRAGGHPHLYDRLVAVGSEPDFPRPAPPARGRSLAAVAVAVAVGAVALIGPRIGLVALTHQLDATPAAGGSWLLPVAAARGGEPHDVALLAHQAREAGETERALALYAAAAEAEGELLWPIRERALLLASLGRCEAAEAAALAYLSAASQRFGPSDPEWNREIVPLMDEVARCRTGPDQGASP